MLSKELRGLTMNAKNEGRFPRDDKLPHTMLLQSVFLEYVRLLNLTELILVAYVLKPVILL